VAKIKSEKKLTIHWIISGAPEENKCKHLQDVLPNQTGVVALDLDLTCDASN